MQWWYHILLIQVPGAEYTLERYQHLRRFSGAIFLIDCHRRDDKKSSKIREKLTFNGSVIVADVEFVNSTLCWHILDRHGPVLVRLDSRLWASCGWHHDRLIERKTLVLVVSTGTYSTHTHNCGTETYRRQ